MENSGKKREIGKNASIIAPAGGGNVLLCGVVALLFNCAAATKQSTAKATDTTQIGGDRAAKKGDSTKESAPEKKEPQQSYPEAWRLICDAEEEAGVDRSASRAERGGEVAQWIVMNVKNKKARLWFVNLGSLKEELRADAFNSEAKSAGVDPCPLSDLLFPTESTDAKVSTDAKGATSQPTTPSKTRPTP